MVMEVGSGLGRAFIIVLKRRKATELEVPEPFLRSHQKEVQRP